MGFVFENSVSKAVLDAHPNAILKVNRLDEQLKVIWAGMDHMQTNLFQICAHANMPAMKLLAKKQKGGFAGDQKTGDSCPPAGSTNFT